MTITIDGRKYMGKTNGKGNYYIKITKKPAVGEKGTVKCKDRKITFTVTKDTSFQIASVSKQIKKGWFILKIHGFDFGLHN